MSVLRLAALALLGCTPGADPAVDTTPERATGTTHADVTSVLATGNPGAWRLAVTVHSPDVGCDRYADWWEAVSPSGELLVRRILGHSHSDEQPFERSGGPVPVDADTTFVVRAHLHPDGYGGQALIGTVADGFSVVSEPLDLPESLASAAPQPDGCAF